MTARSDELSDSTSPALPLLASAIAGAAAGVIAVRLSATVLVVRATEGSVDGFEVLLLRRNDRSGFVAGATLYPGGAVDLSDALVPTSPNAYPSGIGPTTGLHETGWGDADPALVRRLSVVAAARECFEEAGVLLAANHDGSWVRVDQRADLRTDVAFAEALAHGELHVPIDRFVPWGRWVTPLGAPRRYDTHFFVVSAPDDAVIRVDGREIVHGSWWAPSAALAAERAGELRVVTPTRKTLERLVDHGSIPSPSS